MDAVAQWIGEHSVAVFLAVLMALLAVWFGLWRLFERYEEHWWQAAAFVGRHIAAYRYLSLHLLAGLAVCFGAVFAFGSVAEEVLEPEEWDAFDRALAVALNRHATPLGVDMLGAITLLGDKWLIAAIAVAGGVGLALRKRRVLLAGWLASLAGGALLNLALKAAFQRAWFFASDVRRRPSSWRPARRWCSRSASAAFISGCTTSAMSWGATCRGSRGSRCAYRPWRSRGAMPAETEAIKGACPAPRCAALA